MFDRQMVGDEEEQEIGGAAGDLERREPMEVCHLMGVTMRMNGCDKTCSSCKVVWDTR